VDDWLVIQCKHLKVCSLAELERLAVEVEALGTAAGKAGIVVVKRRCGRPTPPLVMMTADAYGRMAGGGRQPGGRPHDPCLCLAAAGLGH
jgi:hypothetical protein